MIQIHLNHPNTIPTACEWQIANMHAFHLWIPMLENRLVDPELACILITLLHVYMTPGVVAGWSNQDSNG